MRKKTWSKSIIHFLFFVILGVVFFVTWGRQLPFDSRIKDRPNEASVQKTGPVISLGPLDVELSGRYLTVTQMEDGKPPYLGTKKKVLRIAVDLELNHKQGSSAMEKQLPRIRAAVSEIISAKTVKDLEHAEGKITLCKEITAKLNHILEKDTVTNVFIREFIIY